MSLEQEYAPPCDINYLERRPTVKEKIEMLANPGIIKPCQLYFIYDEMAHGAIGLPGWYTPRRKRGERLQPPPPIKHSTHELVAGIIKYINNKMSELLEGQQLWGEEDLLADLGFFSRQCTKEDKDVYGKNIDEFTEKMLNKYINQRAEAQAVAAAQAGGTQSYITAQRKDINEMLRRVKREMPQMGRYLEKNLKEINKRCNKVKYKGRYKKVYDQVATNLRRGMARNGM